jgi:hypothetical protein
MFMHELFLLQIDIDALNPRSSLILYFRGSAVSKFRVLKTYHIHFSSHLSFAARFYFPWLIFRIFLFGTRLDQRPRCLLPVISIVWALLTLSLAQIHALFGKLLWRHHASARLPSNLFRSGPLAIVAGGNSRPVRDASAITLLPAFPRIY